MKKQREFHLNLKLYQFYEIEDDYKSYVKFSVSFYNLIFSIVMRYHVTDYSFVGQ